MVVQLCSPLFSTPGRRIGLFADYQKGLRLLAQAASTFARE